MGDVLLFGILLLASAAGRAAEESPVFEAVFRQQLHEHLDAAARARGTLLCLGIDPGQAPQSPNREFMARFKDEPAVRRLTECEARPAGAVEGTTLRPAVIVVAGPIEWREADDVEVVVRYFRDREHSAERRYRVVHEPGGWVALGPILLDGPADPPQP
jgi:hypothetical protein